MVFSEKLSKHLNRYYSYKEIKDAEIDDISNIASEFIKSAEKSIFKQPKIALRAIKVEMLDVHFHYDRY